MTTKTDRITRFDRTTCRLVRERIDAALADLGAELGLDISAGSGSFDAGFYRVKVTCAVKHDDGTVETPEATAFKRLATLYGLKADDLGREFTSRGKTFKVTGLKTRAKKYPVLATDSEGKTYKFPAARVASLLAMEA